MNDGHEPYYWNIVGWQDTFENAQSKRYSRISWVPIPNKHDGKSFRRIAKHDQGPAIFTAWILLVELASKMPVRGQLLDEDGPLTTTDMADKTGFPVGLFEVTLPLLAHQAIRWVEKVPWKGVRPGPLPPLSDKSRSALRAGSEGAQDTLNNPEENNPDKPHPDLKYKIGMGGGVEDEPEGEHGNEQRRQRKESYLLLSQSPHFKGFTYDQFVSLCRLHPKADPQASVEKATLEADLEVGGLQYPGRFLKRRFSEVEMQAPREPEVESDPAVLDYARQYKGLRNKPVRLDREIFDFWLKVSDTLGPEAKARVERAERAIKR